MARWGGQAKELFRYIHVLSGEKTHNRPFGLSMEMVAVWHVMGSAHSTDRFAFDGARGLRI